MRIGIDIKCLRYNNAGIGRYLRCILTAIQDIDSENEYFLFTPVPISFKPQNSNFNVVVCKTKIRQPGIFWQQFVLPFFIRQYKIDVFWGPEQTIPYISLKNVVKILTIHDFVYKRFPKTMVKSVWFINKIFGEKSIQKADIICPVSSFTQKELFHFFPKICKDKVHVINNGVDNYKNINNAIKRGENLLFVGSLEPRKNLESLIQALEILHNEGIDIPLTIIGPSGWKNTTIHKKLKNTSIAFNVTYLGFVTESTLNELYNTSAAVIFPSFYEGFGLPVLEALAHKTPILTSQDSAMEEIATSFAKYFNPYSPSSIANTIKAFYKDKDSIYQDFQMRDSELETLINRYSWVNTVQELLKQFEIAKISKQCIKREK